MGGGGDDFHDVAQQFDEHSNMAQQQMAHVEVPDVPKEDSVGHNIVHVITDSGGVWWLLGLAALGGAGLLKKRIKKWLGISEVKK